MKMQIAIQPKSFHVSPMVFAMVLGAASAVIWCAAWYASKRYQERQRELEHSYTKKTIITIISTILAVLIFQQTRKAIIGLKRRFSESGPTLNYGSVNDNPRSRARCAMGN